MENKIQTNATGQITPCFQHKINKTTYLVEAHFSDTSRQNSEKHFVSNLLCNKKYAVFMRLVAFRKRISINMQKKGGAESGNIRTSAKGFKLY